MRKRLVAIYSVLVVAIVLLAAFVPSCTGGGTGTIYVQATLCGTPWQGPVSYTLTPTSGTPVSGTAAPSTHSGVAAGTWDCAYVSGGPVGACLDSIKPSASQTLAADGNITFILDFELCEDAAIQFSVWSQNGVPFQGPITAIEAVPCNIIDAHFKQWVNGCEDYNVVMNETSWLNITQTAGPPGVMIYVVNDTCAVNKTVVQGPTPLKNFQVPTLNGIPVQKGANTTLALEEPTMLDVHTQWQLVKCLNYTKAINWFGIWVGAYDPGLHPCVLFELVVPLPGMVYQFTIQTGADVAIVGDTDANPANNHDKSAPITLTIMVP